MSTADGTDEQATTELRPPKHRRSLAGALAGKAKRTFPTPEDLEAAIDEAWTYAAREAEGEEAPD